MQYAGRSRVERLYARRFRCGAFTPNTLNQCNTRIFVDSRRLSQHYGFLHVCLILDAKYQTCRFEPDFKAFGFNFYPSSHERRHFPSCPSICREPGRIFRTLACRGLCARIPYNARS